jgi:hypothetical protein
MNLRRLMQSCPSRTSLPKVSIVRHSKIVCPMAEMGQNSNSAIEPGVGW